MNIVVCIKQVPIAENIVLDKDTHNIVRENIELQLNPFDSFAIEEALRLKEKINCKVIAISMGILKAEQILKNAIAMGCDEGILLNDSKFAGSDSMATSYVLAKAIQKIGNVKLIICGRQAVDGDTAQVGPSLAERMNFALVSYVKDIIELNEEFLICKKTIESGYEVLQAKLPALITVVRGINTPRIPSLKGIIKANNIDIIKWNSRDLGVCELDCGLNGSPTRVKNTFQVKYNKKTNMIEGDKGSISEKLLKIIDEKVDK